MDIHAVVDEGRGNSAYVVDPDDGGALVVDPERDPRPNRSALLARGLTPRFVAETHLHADLVSGGRELTAVPGSLSNPWRAQFATWLGWLVRRDRPVVFVADDKVDVRQDAEFVAGHVPGAVHVERAMSAASPLERAGHPDVAVLAGGPDELGPLEVGR